MIGRTDMVFEQTQDVSEGAEGVYVRKYNIGKCFVTEVAVEKDEGAEILKKPKGKYYTLQFDRLDNLADTADILASIKKTLKKLIPKLPESTMVAGLGNADITPDALGPMCIDKILSTRHIEKGLKNDLGLENLRCVSTVIPRVLGKTGIEAVELIEALSKSVKPDVVIVIDALAASSRENLCRCFQLSDTGICPGSGVDNKRKEISKATLGIPVIAIGMPTVIDDGALSDKMMVTPKEIDLYVKMAADILSEAINGFLQPFVGKDVLSVLA